MDWRGVLCLFSAQARQDWCPGERPENSEFLAARIMKIAHGEKAIFEGRSAGPAAVGCSLAFGSSAPPLPEDRVEYLLFVLQDRLGEYLFFIGAFYVGLLLLKKRRWIGAAAVFLLGIVWLAFHLPVSLYLESLGIDSFAETKNFNLEEARFWLQTLREIVYSELGLKKLVAYLAFSLLSFYVPQWLLAQQEFTRRRALLINNQGVCGAWDQVSSVVFKNARKLFRQKPGASAAEVTLVEKVWDHEFFSQQLDALESTGRGTRTATLLHS